MNETSKPQEDPTETAHATGQEEITDLGAVLETTDNARGNAAEGNRGRT